MGSSAFDRAAASDRLERTLGLYRDLSVALRDRITLLKAGIVDKADGKHAAEDAQALRKALQTVHDTEVSLERRSRHLFGGAGGELDLDAARAEIVARLALWVADG